MPKGSRGNVWVPDTEGYIKPLMEPGERLAAKREHDLNIAQVQNDEKHSDRDEVGRYAKTKAWKPKPKYRYPGPGN